MLKTPSSLTKKQVEILYGISNFLTINEIAKYRKTSRTAIYKALNPLIQKGLLRKVGKLYEVTDLGKEGLHNVIGLRDQYRLHNLAVKIKIISSPKNWAMKRNQLVLLKSFTKNWQSSNWESDLYQIGNLKVKTTPQSIIVYLPAFYGKTPEIALEQAINTLFESLPKIENLFKITLIKDRKTNITIISQHYAHLQDALAKKFHSEDKKLYITGEDGKVWLIADYSFQTDELEAIHTEKALDDITTVSTFLNDLRRNPCTISQLSSMIQGITANQVIFDKNMASHLKVLNKIGNAVDRLEKAVSNINKSKINKPENEFQAKLGDFAI